MKRLKQSILPITVGLLLIALGRPWQFINAPDAIATGWKRFNGVQPEY